MNIIDKNFESLTKTIKSQSKEEIFNNIKKCYLKVPNQT